MCALGFQVNISAPYFILRQGRFHFRVVLIPMPGTVKLALLTAKSWKDSQTNIKKPGHCGLIANDEIHSVRMHEKENTSSLTSTRGAAEHLQSSLVPFKQALIDRLRTEKDEAVRKGEEASVLLQSLEKGLQEC